MSKWDYENFTINERIQSARKTVQKAKLLRGKATTPGTRALYANVIAIFEKDERKLLELLRARERARWEAREAAKPPKGTVTWPSNTWKGQSLDPKWPARKPIRDWFD